MSETSCLIFSRSSPPCSWGESAGSISVFLHLFANGGDTEGLFRAGIMSSGSSVPTGDITELQGTYDFVVDQVGCSTSNDTLACLRTVSTDSLLAAANNTPSFIGFSVRDRSLSNLIAELTVRVQGLATPYFPRADGVFVTLPPGQLTLKAEAADVPFIIGGIILHQVFGVSGLLTVLQETSRTKALSSPSEA